jgi:hypothetical protein
MPFEVLAARSHLICLRSRFDKLSAQYLLTNLKIGVGSHVVAFDPPVRAGAVPINAYPGAIGQAAEPAPLIKRQPDESAGANATGQPVCGDDDGRMILGRFGYFGQRLGHALADLTRALASRRPTYVLPRP